MSDTDLKKTGCVHIVLATHLIDFLSALAKNNVHIVMATTFLTTYFTKSNIAPNFQGLKFDKIKVWTLLFMYELSINHEVFDHENLELYSIIIMDSNFRRVLLISIHFVNKDCVVY